MKILFVVRIIFYGLKLVIIFFLEGKLVVIVFNFSRIFLFYIYIYVERNKIFMNTFTTRRKVLGF